jgi:hypothetical protein
LNTDRRRQPVKRHAFKIVEAEIDGLLAEKAEIEKWAAVGSA